MSAYSSHAAPVIAPGFHNRRTKSRHLKNAFPAGFYKKKIDAAAESDVLKRMAVGGTISGSFMDWTKGIKEKEDSNNSGGNADPFESCAGPYLQELLRQRSAEGTKSLRTVKDVPFSEQAVLSQAVETKEVLLHEKSPQKVRSQYPPPRKIYHAPAALPALTANLANSRVGSSPWLSIEGGAGGGGGAGAGAGGNSLTGTGTGSGDSEYLDWLQASRSSTSEDIWIKKGNADRPYNYSAHDFNAETGNRGHSLHLGLGRSASHVEKELPFQEVPEALSPFLTIDLYTKNQITNSEALSLSESDVLRRVVESRVTMHELKGMVVREIVSRLENALMANEIADFVDDESSASMNMRINPKKVDVHFEFYNVEVSGWRPLKTENDWVLALQIAQRDMREMTAVAPHMLPRSKSLSLKIMYALGVQSEGQLLQLIQHHHTMRRERQRLRGRNLSLKAVTDALARATERTMSAAQLQKLRDTEAAVTAVPNSSSCAATPRFTATMASEPSMGMNVTIVNDSMTTAWGERDEKDDGEGAGGEKDRKIESVRVEIPEGQHRHQNQSMSMLSTGNQCGKTGKSIITTNNKRIPTMLHPVTNPSLNRLHQQNELLIPRQEAVALHLEKRLLKTKWLKS